MIYIVFLYFLSLFLFVGRRYSSVSSYLIGVYAFSVLCSVILYQQDVKVVEVSIIPSLIFCLVLLFYFTPFLRKQFIIKIDPRTVFKSRFKKIGYGLSATLILGAIMLYPKVREAYFIGLVETRQAMYKSETVLSSYSIFEHAGHSILKWLSGLSYSVLIFFFYSVTFFKGEKLLKGLLFISSLSAAYLGLLVGGRTNMIYWLLFFVFCLLLFKDFMDNRTKRRIFIGSLGLFFIIAIVFLFITSLRVEYRFENTMESFLLDYAGQSFLNFCLFWDGFDFHAYTLARVTPLSHSLFYGRFRLDEYREMVFANNQMDIGVFYTMLGDIFVDLGVAGIAIYSLIYYYIAKKVLGKVTFSFSRLLLLGICYQIPLHGIFYYSLWRMESSACIIITVIIAKYLEPKISK